MCTIMQHQYVLSQVVSLADFFKEETIFVAYGPERYFTDDFDLDDNGKNACSNDLMHVYTRSSANSMSSHFYSIPLFV